MLIRNFQIGTLAIFFLVNVFSILLIIITKINIDYTYRHIDIIFIAVNYNHSKIKCFYTENILSSTKQCGVNIHLMSIHNTFRISICTCTWNILFFYKPWSISSQFIVYNTASVYRSNVYLTNRLTIYYFPTSCVAFVGFQAHSSFDGQDTCDIKYHLHENLATVLTNPLGVDVLNNLRQNVYNICLDPKAHNGAVGLFDGIIDLTTDTNVSQTLGNTFFWARKIMMNPNFRTVWHENMKGINMVFDNLDVSTQVTETVFDNLELILRNPKFNSTFEKMMQNLSKLLKFRNNVVLKAAGSLFSRRGPAKRSKSRNNNYYWLQ